MASHKAFAGEDMQKGQLEAVARPPRRVSAQNGGGGMGVFAAASPRKRGSEISFKLRLGFGRWTAGRRLD